MSEPQQLEPPFNVHLDSPPVERWAVVADAPKYFVSTNGRVLGPRGIRKPMMENGYPWFDAKVDGVRKCIRIHRAMAIAFMPQEDGKPMVNHVSGVKSENRLDNFEWTDNRGNIQHGWSLGRVSVKGQDHPKHKLTNEQVLEMRRLYSTGLYTKTHLGRMFGVSQPVAGKIIRRQLWRHLP